MNKLGLFLALWLTGSCLMGQQTITLEECRNQARIRNTEIKISLESVKMAEQLKKAAYTRYFPGLSANGMYLRNEKTISLLGQDQYLPVGTKMADGSFGFTAEQVNNGWTQINGQPVPLDAGGHPFDPRQNPEKILWKNYALIPADAFEMDARDVYTGAVTLTQPLFTGGKIRELNRMASCAEEISRLRVQGTMSEILYAVDEAYWRLVSLQQKIRLADQYVQLLERLDLDMQKSIATGMATKSEGLSVKVKLNEAAMMKLTVYDGLILSRMALCNRIGLPVNSDITPADTAAGQEELAYTRPVEPVAAATKRYEIGVLTQLLKISESERNMARARFMPNLIINAGYLLSNPNMYNGFETKAAGMWQAGLVLNVPLFQWGERLHTLKAASVGRNIAELRVSEAREKIELEVSQAVFRTNEAAKKLEITQSNLRQAEENLKLARLGFDAGLVTATILMEAQTAWLKATTDQIDAGIEYRLRQVSLEKAMGNLQ